MPMFDVAIFDGISPPSFMFDTAPPAPVAGIKSVRQAQIHDTQGAGSVHGTEGNATIHDTKGSGRVTN